MVIANESLMPDHRQVWSNGGGGGGVVNPSVGELEGALRRLKVDHPERPGEQDCVYYLRTRHCGYGNNCRFNHPAFVGQGVTNEEELPERVGKLDCLYYLRTGTCKYGSLCKYHHPPDRHNAAQVVFNSLGLPMRQEEKSCPFYMRNGHCKYAAACKFHHPEPGLPFQQVFQNYAPFILPTQSIMPSNGWNAYLGCLSPSSAIPSLGSDLSYYKSVVEPGSSSMESIVSHLPERPDKPECRNYLNTGSCKYGSGCKFHHSRERAPQSVPNTLGPLGLPMRPGEAVCSFYSSHGLCKYGPTCKFDHPFAGYSYSMSLPTLSSTLYHRMNPSPSMVYYAEACPTKSSYKLITGWTQKPEVVPIDKDQVPTVETSSEQSVSL
ncbi:zinc finger CCCH domain-containing protein 3-like [Impatiens glandulifera]|uniref:zinc finger CCCH domain-containing protein 3-like n=1 Tax=Impatiens glandulifera TaxID=253017 RepID=UPI001FB12E4D|nr:zinc finger CCCH domain-containing protein 3-like [Impatiens glandulifera]